MDTKAIGQRIKKAREATGITQDELAKAVDCSTKHIGALERGIKTPSLDMLVVIANTLGVSADLLLQDVLEKPVDSRASEFAAAVAPLSEKMQNRVLQALRVFAGNGD